MTGTAVSDAPVRAPLLPSAWQPSIGSTSPQPSTRMAVEWRVRRFLQQSV